jgi:hypothetical protein
MKKMRNKKGKRETACFIPERCAQFLGAVTVHSSTCCRPVYLAPEEIITMSLKFIKQ